LPWTPLESVLVKRRPLETQQASTRREDLRTRVLNSLQEQGFILADRGIIPPRSQDKDALRRLHTQALSARVERARGGLARHEERLLQFFANGDEVDVASIAPVLREVHPHSEEELLFRYARLHWSVPISAGYGRRLRFLVLDSQNGKLIGLIGLGDPVFGLGPRDRWVGWDRETRRERLRFVLDAFAVGAVPPYSQLLCGKLVAMLAASMEVTNAFKEKYSVGESLISRRQLDGRLALITTTSALGRSSIYNRLQFHGRQLFIPIGFTMGSGEFQFSNGIYSDLREYARTIRLPTAKHERWGSGWRSRREIVRIVLPQLGLPRELNYHGVRRQVFAVPLASNTREFLRGEQSRLRSYGHAADELFGWFRTRWLLPRADWDERYREVQREDMGLWTKTPTLGLAGADPSD
jgi:Druantia protein DruA